MLTMSIILRKFVVVVVVIVIKYRRASKPDTDICSQDDSSVYTFAENENIR